MYFIIHIYICISIHIYVYIYLQIVFNAVRVKLGLYYINSSADTHTELNHNPYPLP